MSVSKLTRVALVGRPNVGKSTLFNRLTRSKKAVVRDEPGVTRDLQSDMTEWWGATFEVVDTGGLSESKEGFTPLIRLQVLKFLDLVDVIVLVMDGRTGLLPDDRMAFQAVKATGKPFLVVVNKCDNTLDPELYLSEFYEFGHDVVAAAFEQDFGIDQVVEWIAEQRVLTDAPQTTTIAGADAASADEVLVEHSDDLNEEFRIAILGKPNAGKSSLCNCLLGEGRLLVSPTAGTTVDAIAVRKEARGQSYVFIDTAGLRRQGKQADGVEVLSSFKTRQAVHRADLVLLVIDGVVGPSMQDARLMELCLEDHKAVIVVANKTDLGRRQHENFREWFRAQVERRFPFFADVPLVFVSAITAAGVEDLWTRVEKLRRQLDIRISTSKLNKFFTEVIKQAPSPVYGSQNVKFYYLTQTKQKPPSFIAFANHPEGVTPAYRRFLARKIQENWQLQGVPVRIFVMPKT